jgi:hypothetical protein
MIMCLTWRGGGFHTSTCHQFDNLFVEMKQVMVHECDAFGYTRFFFDKIAVVLEVGNTLPKPLIGIQYHIQNARVFLGNLDAVNLCGYFTPI